MNQAFFGMAEALAMLIESRSVEGARLTSLSRLKQHTSLGRCGKKKTSSYIESFLADNFYHIS